MSLMGFQRRRRELARQKELEGQKKQNVEIKKAEDQLDEPNKKLYIDDLKKDDIIKMLEEQEIEYNPRDKKEVLFDLLVGD